MKPSESQVTRPSAREEKSSPAIGQPEACAAKSVLVLNGGLSCGSYMNGIAQEFFQANRATGLHGILQRSLGIQFNTEIISGSGVAGSINSLLLGYCLANQKDFRTTSQFWVKKLGLMNLMESTGRTNAESLLRSDIFFEEIKEAFAQIPDDFQGTSLQAVPSIKEIDVFMDATNLHGRWNFHPDGLGKISEMLDFSAHFHLKYRHGRKNHFWHEGNANSTSGKPQAETIERLALLARAASASPLIFEPGRLDKDLFVDKSGSKANVNVRNYLDAHQTHSWFVDGSLVCKRPFTEALHEISSRPEDKRVHWTFYHPDFAGGDVENVQNTPSRSSVAELLGDRYFSISQHEWLKNDLENLTRMKLRLSRYHKAIETVKVSLLGTRSMHPQKEASPVQQQIYFRFRVKALVEQLFSFAPRELSVTPKTTLPGQTTNEEWRECLAEAEGFFFDLILENITPEFMDDLDIFKETRRIDFAIQELNYFAYHNPAQKDRLNPELLGRFGQLKGRLYQLRHFGELLTTYLRKGFEEITLTGAFRNFVLSTNNDIRKDSFNRVWDAFEFVLRTGLNAAVSKSSTLDIYRNALRLAGQTAVTKLKSGTYGGQLVELRTDFQKKKDAGLITYIRDEVSSIADEVHELSEQIKSAIPASDPPATLPLENIINQFESFDEYAFVLAFIGDLKLPIQPFRTSLIPYNRNEDPITRIGGKIHTVSRANPLSANLLKASWRANDLMWGRIDAAISMAQGLFTHDHFHNASKDTGVPQEQLLRDLKKAIDRQVENNFGTGTTRDFDLTLTQLHGSMDGVDPIEQMRIRWLLALELSILQEELPRIYQAALEESTRSGFMERNQFSWFSGSINRLASVTQALREDRALLEISSAELEARLRLMWNAPSKLVHFLQKHYQENDHQLESIEPSILREAASRMSRITMNVLAHTTNSPKVKTVLRSIKAPLVSAALVSSLLNLLTERAMSLHLVMVIAASLCIYLWRQGLLSVEAGAFGCGVFLYGILVLLFCGQRWFKNLRAAWKNLILLDFVIIGVVTSAAVLLFQKPIYERMEALRTFLTKHHLLLAVAAIAGWIFYFKTLWTNRRRRH